VEGWLGQADRKAAMRRVHFVLSACLAVLILGPVGCGSDDSKDESTATTTTTSTAERTTAVPTGLVGEWRTDNICEDQVQAFKEAGLDDLVSEWVEDYPGQKPTDSDPCHGAKPVEHSHGFGESGSFASYDANGQQVDAGTYTPVDDRTFTLGDPPVAVQYRIEGDKATFDVVIPDCQGKRCRESAAYVTSVFFPRVYERVK
jgi:hypothetical protein